MIRRTIQKLNLDNLKQTFFVRFLNPHLISVPFDNRTIQIPDLHGIEMVTLFQRLDMASASLLNFFGRRSGGWATHLGFQEEPKNYQRTPKKAPDTLKRPQK